MEKTYFNPEDLKKFGNIVDYQQKMGEKFFEWYGEVFSDGSLSKKEKGLIALAVAHVVQCPYCIDAYTTECLTNGYTEEQMMEAVHTGAAIKSGATLVNSVQMTNKISDISM